jgi:hypothetical protein
MILCSCSGVLPAAVWLLYSYGFWANCLCSWSNCQPNHRVVNAHIVGACALIKKQETDLLFIVVLLYIELLSRTFDSVFHARVLSSVSLFCLWVIIVNLAKLEQIPWLCQHILSQLSKQWGPGCSQACCLQLLDCYIHTAFGQTTFVAGWWFTQWDV